MSGSKLNIQFLINICTRPRHFLGVRVVAQHMCMPSSLFRCWKLWITRTNIFTTRTPTRSTTHPTPPQPPTTTLTLTLTLTLTFTAPLHPPSVWWPAICKRLSRPMLLKITLSRMSPYRLEFRVMFRFRFRFRFGSLGVRIRVRGQG